MRASWILFLVIAPPLAMYAGQHVAPSLGASVDTMYVTGGTLAGKENVGALEAAVNGDTLANGARINPHRVYALNEGQVYYQRAAISFNDPNATLIIAGVPSSHGTQKPVILMDPQPGSPIAANTVYGSIVIVNVHWQVMQLDRSMNNELFFCGTGITQPQSLTIDNCLFEFSNVDLFDCTNEPGAIGGWPHGASFRIMNSYFRDLFYSAQWWDSRIFQCKHPIDTMWIENNTITGGGLTFLQQNQLTDFQFINHNTIINNKKFWLTSPYKHTSFITNNIFINQNWSGEDTNIVVSSTNEPGATYVSTIDIDTNTVAPYVEVQDKYRIDSVTLSPELDFDHMRVFVSDNVNYYDPALLNGYYLSSKYLLPSINAIPSYINWGEIPNPTPVRFNVWMNTRTQHIFADHQGPFIERRTSTADPGLTTPAIANAAVVDSMAAWNQYFYEDPRFPNATDLTGTKYEFGDDDPRTIPGVKTENGSGIAKFTDLTESFRPTAGLTSGIDGLPVGSLIWDDAQNAVFMAGSPTDRFNQAKANYLIVGGVVSANPGTGFPARFSLAQNCPNPFNPTTVIGFTLSKQATVDLKVYNLLGQEVATLAHGIFPAGQHSVTFNAMNLASGVYFYRLTAGEFTGVMKMALVK